MFRIVFSGTRFMLILACICGSCPVFAQQGFLLKGVLFQKQNGQHVANALILNRTNKITVASNDLGAFNIKAAVGDTLRIFKKDYTEYIFTVIDQKDVVIQLSPVIQLNEVKIVGQTKKQELDEGMRAYRGQGSFYNGKPPALSFLTSPITGLYELFGKTPKQAKHFQEFSKNETEQISIDKRFNQNVIKQVTDLKEEQIQPFMESYRPSFDQLNAWNDYDLINYIKKSAQGFKEGKGLPPLKKLY
ncbi:hypothetical protein [Mucilaginibacter arboris]|uniref:Carboxypeptidase-like regulatory domain-containing protein n=1 Tax=Mucilaginibacter arboris TaxID=2682090 RepID=A0A7K1SV77_9SPHI|nr:hypothetical protein [Mucilaginibacter arboris]MVN21249.1 hypothetical protein [Mucilaginibacter arboris]